MCRGSPTCSAYVVSYEYDDFTPQVVVDDLPNSGDQVAPLKGKRQTRQSFPSSFPNLDYYVFNKFAKSPHRGNGFIWLI